MVRVCKILIKTDDYKGSLLGKPRCNRSNAHAWNLCAHRSGMSNFTL